MLVDYLDLQCDFMLIFDGDCKITSRSKQERLKVGWKNGEAEERFTS